MLFNLLSNGSKKLPKQVIVRRNCTMADFMNQGPDDVFWGKELLGRGRPPKSDAYFSPTPNVETEKSRIFRIEFYKGVYFPPSLEKDWLSHIHKHAHNLGRFFGPWHKREN
jgi:hypothetical protein